MRRTEGPDRGRAWLIAFAACIINMILSGISRMIGILYVAVIDNYGVSRAEATTPFSTRNSVRCLSGPLVGLLGQHLSIRIVTLTGGIVAAAGAALCSIAPNIVWLTVFWGGIHGFGFAFANTLFQVTVNQYFDKYRATASGLALSGACFGAIGFPFLFEYIVDTFGLSGAFLILGGVVLHVLPPAILLQEPPWIKRNKNKENTKNLPNGSSTSKKESEDFKEIFENCRSASLSNCPANDIELLSFRKLTCTEKCPSRKGAYMNGGTDGKISSVFTVHNNSLPEIVVNLKNELNCTNTNETQEENGLCSKLMNMVSLFKSPIYVLISVCMATYVIIFIPILTVIVDYGKDKGLQEHEGKYLINAMACGDLVGRLCFGWVTDRGFMTIPKFMMLTLTLQGVFIGLFPFAMSLYTFIILLALYGMMAGSILVLFPILVYKYVAGDQQPIAMGCVGFLSGLVTFSAPPLIGHFRDHVGSYDGMFYLTGGISFLNGAMWLLEPSMLKLHQKNQHKKQIDAKLSANS